MLRFLRMLAAAGAGEEPEPHGGGEPPEENEYAVDKTGGGMFLLMCLAIGLLTRNVLAPKLPFPYTVILLLIGVMLGVINKFTNGAQYHDAIEIWARIEPELILVIFLPTLIFESAFSIDFHVFRRSFWQIFALAVPGMVLGTVLTAWAVVGVFPYNWTWAAGLTFGSILSATDPVAVVALLKELGASKQLETLIEGESLLNDGTAIVAYSLFSEFVKGSTRDAGGMIGYGLQLSLGGPALGAVFALAAIVMLGYIYNDTVSEITVTFVACYSVFILADATVIHTSGVLAVVTLGVLMSAYGRVRISPEVEHYLHSFWEMMAYIANTVIFLLSGVIIVEKTLYTEEITGEDWGYLIVLYILLHLIRFAVILAMSPALVWTGYPVDWKNATVLGYAGLRGAVGLALGLIVEQDVAFDASTDEFDKDFRAHVLFFVAGIAFLTLLINGSTTNYLLEYLGMGGDTEESRRLFEQSCSMLNQRIEQRVDRLQKDPQFHKADWRQLWAYMHVPTRRVYEERKEKGHTFQTKGELHTVPPRLHGRWKRYYERFDSDFCDPVPQVPPPGAATAKPTETVSVSTDAAASDDSPSPVAEARPAVHSDDWDEPIGNRVGLELLGVSLPMFLAPAMPCLLVDRSARARARRQKEADSMRKLAPRGSILSDPEEAASKDDGGPSAKADPASASASAPQAEDSKSVANPLAGALSPPPAPTDGTLLAAATSQPATVAAPASGMSREELRRLKNVAQTRRKFLGAVRAGYWHRFEEGLTSRTAVRVLLDAVDWQVDQDPTKPLSSFEGALAGSIAVPGWVRFCHGVASLGKLVRPVLFAQLQLLYDSAANFIATYEKAISKSKYWAIGGTADTVIAEARAEIDLARDLLDSIDTAFPEVIRAVQTAQAVRALLISERNEIESLSKDGALEPSQHEELLARNNASLKKATQHPPSHEVSTLRELMAGMPFFRGVDAKILRKLKAASKRRLFKAGETIFTVGEEADAVDIVVSGAVKLFANDARVVSSRGFNIGLDTPTPGAPPSKQISRGTSRSNIADRSRKALLSRREGPGHVLGLLDVLIGTPRLVTAKAETPVEVVHVPASVLAEAMASSHVFATRMWAEAACNVAELFLETFSRLSPASVRSLMQSGALVVPAGRDMIPAAVLPGCAATRDGKASAASTRALRAAKAGSASPSASASAGDSAAMASPMHAGFSTTTPPPLPQLALEAQVGTASAPGFGLGGWISTRGDEFILLRGTLEQSGTVVLDRKVQAFRTIHPCPEQLRFSSDALLLRIPQSRLKELDEDASAEHKLARMNSRAAVSSRKPGAPPPPRLREPRLDALRAAGIDDGLSSPMSEADGSPTPRADSGRASPAPTKLPYAALVENTRRLTSERRPDPKPAAAAASASE